MNIITPYKGKRTYIFISYAHKDSEKVYRVIEQLNKARCRVWYDEGIEYGTEWSDEIADRLSKSDCVIAFISQNYNVSKNCISELKYAMCSLHKECLLVYLENAKLPSGIEMYMDATQAIRREAYKDESGLWTKILKAPMVLRNQGKEFAQAIHCSDQARVFKETNRKEEAAKLYRKAIEILHDVAEENQEEENYNDFLIENCSNLAMLLKEMGRKKEAAEAYQEEKEVRFRLIVMNPEKEAYKSAYADCCDNLAKIWREMGQREKAVEVYREALEYRKLLAKKNPKKEEYQLDLILEYYYLSIILVDMDQREEAEKLYRRGIEICGGLIKKNPVRYIGLQNMGRISLARCIEKRNPKEAEELYQKAITAFRDQTAKSPQIKAVKYNQAKSCVMFARFLAEMNRKGESVKLYQEALEIIRSLIIEDPENNEWDSLESSVYESLCDLLEETAPEKVKELREKNNEFSQKREVEKARKKIKSLRSLAEKNPEEETPQYSLAEAYGDLERLGRYDAFTRIPAPGTEFVDIHQEAETALREARGILSSLVSKHPENEKYWDKLFFYSLRLADDYLGKENPKEAEGLYREVIGMLPSLAMKHPGEEKYWNKLNSCYRDLARGYLSERNPKEAEELYRKAMEIDRRQIKDHPGEFVYEAGLADTCDDLGALLKKIGQKKEAVEVYQEAIEIVSRAMGIDQDEWDEWHTVSVESWLEELYVDLTALLKELNRTKEAEELRQKVWVGLLGYK